MVYGLKIGSAVGSYGVKYGFNIGCSPDKACDLTLSKVALFTVS